MKLLLTTLNASYVHSSLALRTLARVATPVCEIEVAEYTINDVLDAVTADIFSRSADVTAFSCYLWNITQTLRICDFLKKANPRSTLVLGGPEVSFDAPALLQAHPYIDCILTGEGEGTLPVLLQALEDGGSLSQVPGLVWRDGEQIVINPSAPPLPLEQIPFAYDEGNLPNRHKIVYYETSRGCPFSCAYCLSGGRNALRFLPMERVRKELQWFIDREVPLVKLVDRTFNADRRRADEIFQYIIDHPGKTRFHFELAGDLLDDTTLAVLRKAPEGLMQFEIGIQSTNPDTIAAVGRVISFDVLKRKVTSVLEPGNIHVHVDLIAGLPREDLQSFIRSFDQTMALHPHVLQLGFLKLLRGSRLRIQADEFGCVYADTPPYEVIATNVLSYADLVLLKRVEQALERYYNGGGFERSMAFLFERFGNRYLDCFLAIADYMCEIGVERRSLSKSELYDILYAFGEKYGETFVQALKYDFMRNVRGTNLPDWCDEVRDRAFVGQCLMVAGMPEFLAAHFPDYAKLPAKKVIRRICFGRFGKRILAFDPSAHRAVDSTGYFSAVSAPLDGV